MKAVIKERWLTLLRYGNYPKCVGRLHMKTDRDHYCALGLCYLAAGLDPDKSDGNYDDIRKVAELDTPLTIISMNDGIRRPSRTFAEIADWVEANL